MKWIRASKACQMKRTRRLPGVEEGRTRRERTNALFSMRRTARRETTVVVSRIWSNEDDILWVGELRRGLADVVMVVWRGEKYLEGSVFVWVVRFVG